MFDYKSLPTIETNETDHIHFNNVKVMIRNFMSHLELFQLIDDGVLTPIGFSANKLATSKSIASAIVFDRQSVAKYVRDLKIDKMRAKANKDLAVYDFRLQMTKE